MKIAAWLGPMLLGLALGAADFVIPVVSLASESPAKDGTATAPGIAWSPHFAWALEEAKAENKVVMVDFFTHWCHWCKVLDRQTYIDPKVCELASRIVSVKVNAESEVGVAERYGVTAYPTISFLNPDGSLRREVKGFLPPDRFAEVMREVMSADDEISDYARRVWKQPQDEVSRAALASLLSMSGEHAAAAAQLDTLLLLTEVAKEAKAGYALDRSLELLRAGQSDVARDGLETWLDQVESSPRRVEAEFFLARIEESQGRKKQAKKLYERVMKVRPGSWFAAESKERLAQSKG